jgi:5,10-methylenetetrahydromethanopterin reductase
VPIVIGGVGPKMLELAGEIADGVLLNYCVPTEYNDMAMEHLETGARRAGRSLHEIDRFQLVVCCVNDNREEAVESSRELLTQYLAQQPHIAQASGFSPEAVTKIQSILGWPATKEQIQQAKHLVPDELIHRITASGTRDEARRKVQEYVDHGAICPVLYAVGCDVRLLVDTFRPAVKVA